MKCTKGFSIVETLIAGAIMAGVVLVIYEFVGKTKQQYTDFEGKMLVTADVNQAFHTIAVDLANLARLTDKGEEIEVVADLEKTYLGIHGLSSVEATTLSDCHYEPATSTSGYSIIRYTTINQQRPSKLLKYWKENAVPMEDLIVAHTDGLYNQVFSEVLDGETQSLTKEIIVLDGDGFTTTRLLVKDVKYIESNVDPYDGVNKSPLVFKYFKVKVQKPHGLYVSSDPQPLLTHQFITGSYVYAVSTKGVCISKDKTRLMVLDETIGTYRSILNVQTEKAVISSFRIHYLFSNKLESNPMGLTEYPVSDATTALGRRCIDQLLVAMDVTKGQKTFTFSQNIFIENYNIKRPGSCM